MNRMITEQEHATAHPTPKLRIGAIAYLNTEPLIYGLEEHPEVELIRKPPAYLAQDLAQGRLDVALVPCVDWPALADCCAVLPINCIGSKGAVLTVRVFSRRAPEQLETLAVDADSHTAVVLAQLIWRQRYQRKLRIETWDGDPDRAEAVLMIGDKVVGRWDGWSYQCDLGQAWTDLTGLPFVYAFWAVRRDADIAAIAAVLQQSRAQGQLHLDELVKRRAQMHGFTEELAKRYFREHLFFDFNREQHRGLRRFYDMAAEAKLVPTVVSLRMADGVGV